MYSVLSCLRWKSLKKRHRYYFGGGVDDSLKFLWLSTFFHYIQPRLIMGCTCLPGISADCDLIFMEDFSLTIQGPSWPWSYGSWIYNYLCNRCLSPLMLWVRIYVSCLSSSVKVTNVISKEIISSIFGPTRNNYHHMPTMLNIGLEHNKKKKLFVQNLGS